MSDRFADISFPVPMGAGLFTYHCGGKTGVPEPGARVVVNIHNRPAIGYVIRTHDDTPSFKTSPLIQIVDPVSLFSETMIKLGLWMAAVCFCTPGEALHAMLPGGIKKKLRRFIIPAPGPEKLPVPASLKEIFRWLQGSGESPWENFIAKFPDGAAAIAALKEMGLVAVVHSQSGSAGPRFIQQVVLDESFQLGKTSLTPKETLVIECILRTNSPMTPAQLGRAASVSSGPINQLRKKGVVRFEQKQVFRAFATESYYAAPVAAPPVLNPEQQTTLDSLRSAFNTHKKPFLIRGVTCSGKTEVYLRWVGEVLEMGKGAIVLVPEISLTPQTTKRFRDRFQDRVAILHSKMSDGERFDHWEEIRAGNKPVVVGARSAVFAPLPNLGTIIIDEEGEPSFKQSETPRYHARDVAARRCALEGGILVMGSATPTLESFYNTVTHVFELAEMRERVGSRALPKVEVVDMRQEMVTRHNRSMFSLLLQKSISEALGSDSQVILYLNRRGHSSFVMCRSCGNSINCSKCRVSLVYHSGSKILRCHYCGEFQGIPKICPSCSSTAIKFFGAGTQRIESEATRYFPKARIQRMDSDTVSHKGSMEEILDRFDKGEIDILIGTQMVAKGLDFPNVTLVGILAADALLRLPDFRASERNFSLLSQVSGRAGRGDRPGKVVLQTYFPEHHSIRHALTENYQGFFDEELAHRRESGFPPFLNVVYFLLSGEDRTRCVQAADGLRNRILELGVFNESMILGPAPAPIEMINLNYRFQLLLKHCDHDLLTESLKPVVQGFRLSGVRISVDMNPFFAL